MPTLNGIQNSVNRFYNTIKRCISKNGIALPGLVQGAIWIIGLTLLIAATVKDFTSVLDEYRFKNEAIEIKVQPLNESIPAPQLALGIPHVLVDKMDHSYLMMISQHVLAGTVINCTECQKLAIESWDVWKDLDINHNGYKWPDEVYNALSLAFVRRLLHIIETNETQLPESEEWGEALVISAMNFFQWQAFLDFHFDDRTRAPAFGPANDSISNIMASYERTTIDKLWNYTLYYLCNSDAFMLISEKPLSEQQRIVNDIRCTSYLQGTDIPIRFDYSSFYFPLAKTDDMHQPSFQFLLWDPLSEKVTFEESIWTWTSRDPFTTLDLYSDPTFLYRSELEQQRDSPMIRETLSYTNNWTEISVMYTTTSKIQETRDDMMDKCFKEMNYKICIPKCIHRWLVDNCQCVPFTYHQTVSDINGTSALPYCNETLYELCNPMDHQDEVLSKCTNQCERPCTYWSYNWIIKSRNIPGKQDVGFHINIIPANSPVIQFSWVGKTSTEQFLASIGGTLGLYLGLSGLSLCAFIISCVDFTKQCRQSRKNHAEEKMASAQAISLWQKVMLNKAITHMNENPGTSTNGQLELKAKAEVSEEISQRFQDLEKKMDQIEKRMDQFENKIDQLENKVDQKNLVLENKMDQMIQQMQQMAKIIDLQNPSMVA